MHHRDAVVTEGRLSYYAARQIVLVVHTPSAVFKICRISFGADGSIYVSFPYCVEKEGILNTFSRQGKGPQEVNLADGGIRVPTDVKFSHHTSGVARFSKTGSLDDGPRRDSFPLDGPIGHIFDLTVIRPDGFDQLRGHKKRDLYLGFHFADGVPSAVQINAEWRRKRDILANTHPPGGSVSAVTTVMHPASGNQHPVYFVGPPQGGPLTAHVLMIHGGAVALPSGADHRSGLVFLGGWNQHERTDTSTPQARFGLVFLYPSGPDKSTHLRVPLRRRRWVLACVSGLLTLAVLWFLWISLGL